jgi:cell pole-organizing protein PopZ
MPDAKPPEPTIEEILASIRKIISDDEPESPLESAPAQMAPVEEEPDDDILELTEKVVDQPPNDNAAGVDEEVIIPNESENKPVMTDDNEALASPATVAAASGAFARLTHVDPLSAAPLHHGGGGKTVEDIARELLKPVLKEWIDQNLAGIVERLVEHELRKISRKSEDL